MSTNQEDDISSADEPRYLYVAETTPLAIPSMRNKSIGQSPAGTETTCPINSPESCFDGDEEEAQFIRESRIVEKIRFVHLEDPSSPPSSIVSTTAVSSSSVNSSFTLLDENYNFTLASVTTQENSSVTDSETLERRSSFIGDKYEEVVSHSNAIDDDNVKKGLSRDVFVRNDAYGWVRGVLLQERDDRAIVQVKWPDSTTTITVEGVDMVETVTVYYKEYPGECLPLPNTHDTKRDMVDLEHLHEAAIFHNLKQRHADLNPYTGVRDILVAMNTFQWIDGLYTEARQDEYSHRVIGKKGNHELLDYKIHFDRMGIERHVHEVSTLAYRRLVLDAKDQTILVTGDSGAGKTETVKFLMSHLASISESSIMGIEDLVCQSSPIFEAFGNAKTLCNDNSSRFGKYVQIQFARRDMIGCIVSTYLLERSRVVSHAPRERSYHIFYQLMASGQEFKTELWPTFAQRNASDFSFLSHSGTMQKNYHPDGEHWKVTLKAVEAFGFTRPMLLDLMRAVAIVLQLGNINFGLLVGSDDCTVILAKEELSLLSEMIGIDSVKLEEGLISSTMRIGEEVVKMNNSPDVAHKASRSLAKEIYSKVFSLIVCRINEVSRVSPEASSAAGTISLLDIFGLEHFETNRFEQLCINYANEKLHSKYVLDNFIACKEEYEREGVDLYDFGMVDNSCPLELLEGKEGISSALNEECLRPGGKDVANFVSKVMRQGRRRSSLLQRRIKDSTEFSVNHFAGVVVYTADEFSDRNMAKLPTSLAQMAAESSNMIISQSFNKVAMGIPGTMCGSIQQKKCVLHEFQSELKGLMVDMADSETQYIRCIKPNDQFVPRKTDLSATLKQLKCSGIMTAIAMTKEGYPDKLEYAIIESRFCSLFQEADLPGMTKMTSANTRVELALRHWLKPVMYKCGTTKVYFKAGGKECLELLLLEYWAKAVTLIQSQVRILLVMRALGRTQSAILSIQAIFRMSKDRKYFLRARQAAVLVSATIRRHQTHRRLHTILCERAAIRIQERFRVEKMVRKFRQRTVSAIRIQKVVRDVQTKLTAATLIAAFLINVHARCILMQLRQRDHSVKVIQWHTREYLQTRIKNTLIIQVSYLRYALKARLRRACVANRRKQSQPTAEISLVAKTYSRGYLSGVLDVLERACCYLVHDTVEADKVSYQ